MTEFAQDYRRTFYSETKADFVALLGPNRLITNIGSTSKISSPSGQVNSPEKLV